jgi:hypothetical protein
MEITALQRQITALQIATLLADPSRAALASGEADTKPAMHD